MTIASAWLMFSVVGSILSSYIPKKRLIVYLLFLSCLSIGNYLTKEFSVGYRMFYLVLITFVWIKCIVLVEYLPEKDVSFPFKKRLLFIFAWVGMNPATFFTESLSYSKDTDIILWKSLIFLGLGSTLIFIISKIALQEALTVEVKWIISYISLFAVSCILHFGFIPLSTVIVRMLGYPATSFFTNPFKSEGLAGFWGRNWNIPYAEMIEAAVFIPLRKQGLTLALLSSFIFSGFLHEIAFSLPIDNGYGLPTVYFLIQGIFILFERRYLRESPSAKKILMYSVLFLPLPLLFHPSFMKEIVWPILNFS